MIQHKAIEEGLKSVVSVHTETVDPSNEGRLVHFTGKAVTDDDIEDYLFGVAPDGLLKLNRKVEMYQWTESQKQTTTKNAGGSTDTTTTFTYSKEWNTETVDSSSFEDPRGHYNPRSMMFSSTTFEASPIYVGAFTLSTSVTNKIRWFQPLRSNLSTDTIPKNTAASQAKAYGNEFYFGRSTIYPEVGDIKISYEEIPEQIISVVAQQTGSTFSTFMASLGGSILLVERGQYDAAEMFQHAKSHLVIMTWMLRLVGFIFVFLSFQFLLGPLSVFADVIPCIGDLVEGGNSCVSFCLAGVASTIVIAIAWFAYRPLLSIFLFALVGGAIYSARKYRNSSTVGDYEIPIAHAYEVPSEQNDNETPLGKVV